MEAEVAQLRAFRSKSKLEESHQVLHNKIMDAERAYLNRKSVYAKASQVASAECRLQFSRVRKFFEELHNSRKDALQRQHARSQNMNGLMSRLQGMDPRVKALDLQVSVKNALSFCATISRSYVLLLPFPFTD